VCVSCPTNDWHLAERVFTIAARSTPGIEVVISHDGVGITIRDANNHDDSFEFPSTMVCVLIKTLQDVERSLNSPRL
jgi:hypothetical protein